METVEEMEMWPWKRNLLIYIVYRHHLAHEFHCLSTSCSCGKVVCDVEIMEGVIASARRHYCSRKWQSWAFAMLDTGELLHASSILEYCSKLTLPLSRALLVSIMEYCALISSISCTCTIFSRCKFEIRWIVSCTFHWQRTWYVNQVWHWFHWPKKGGCYLPNVYSVPLVLISHFRMILILFQIVRVYHSGEAPGELTIDPVEWKPWGDNIDLWISLPDPYIRKVCPLLCVTCNYLEFSNWKYLWLHEFTIAPLLLLNKNWPNSNIALEGVLCSHT